MTTLSSAVKKHGYSAPGILMTAGPRGAAAPIHRMDQKPQEETMEGTREQWARKTPNYYFKSLQACDSFFKGHAF